MTALAAQSWTDMVTITHLAEMDGSVATILRNRLDGSVATAFSI